MPAAKTSFLHMSKLSLFVPLNGSEIFFLVMVAQVSFALWLSYRSYRDEPNWQTLSMLGSLLFMGIPGYLGIRLLRSRCQSYMENFTQRSNGNDES